MWAGVAGGLAEYFDIDPSLVRLIWVAAAVVSGGLAIPVYILAWIILPRDDRPPSTSVPSAWRDWSQEFHDETHRLAEWSRQVAHEWEEPRPGATAQQERADTRSAPGEQSAASAEASADMLSPASDKGRPIESGPTEPPPNPWGPSAQPAPPEWQSPTDLDRHHRRPRSAGILLVGLGVLLLAANAGIFNMIEWRFTWPLIFIGLGIVLLVRQTDWFGH